MYSIILSIHIGIEFLRDGIGVRLKCLDRPKGLQNGDTTFCTELF